MTKLRREMGPLPAGALAQPRIDRLVLIDREVDLATPLVTQVGGSRSGDDGLPCERTSLNWRSACIPPREQPRRSPLRG
jgi:hypothetical protein